METQRGFYQFTPYKQQEPQRQQQRRARHFRHDKARCTGTVCVTCGDCQCRNGGRGAIGAVINGQQWWFCDDYCWVRRQWHSV